MAAASFMREFSRAHHRVIAEILHSLDADRLIEAQCYFGGGTRIALALDEFRESRDIDFLCASRAGFRALRESITQTSLGRLMRKPVPLAREVRADRDGIRAFFAIDSVRIKFEIVLEGRIDLAGAMDRKLGVPVLDMDHTVAEKLLANADRGLDESTHARDLVDLAFLAAGIDKRGLRCGLAIAQGAYGAAVLRQLQASLSEFSASRPRAAGHLRTLGVTDTLTLRKGLKILRELATGPAH